MDLQKENELGTKSVGKLLFSLALPAITAQIVNVLYNMVDRMFIGHIPEIGAQALTGVGLTFPIIMVISAFASLVSMGGAPRASIMMGQGKTNVAEKIMGNCTSALIIISLVLTVVIYFGCEPMLMAFGASVNTIGYAADYVKIYACGTIFVQLALGLNAFITSQGFAKTSMLTVLIGAVINIILDPILIFTFGLGVKGAAYATVISQGVSAVWVVLFLNGKKTTLKIRKENLKIVPRILFPCLALGISPFVMQATESLIAICFNSSLLKYGGDLAVGSMTILNSVMQFSMLPLMGLTQGSQPIISYNYGAGKTPRVKKTFKLLIISALIYSVTLWALVMIAPQMFAQIFTSDPKLIAMVIPTMRIFMASSLFFGIQGSCQQTFIALGNAKASLFLALLRKVFLLIPLIYILPLLLSQPVLGVFLAEPIADLIAVIVTASMFISQFRKLIAE
ncbi:MAG: MATE family efflux transporter, partial [Oscillospiraceae bacterium]